MPLRSQEVISSNKIWQKSYLWIVIALLLLLVNVLTIAVQAPKPGTDLFLFKDAGVNLSLKGKFVTRNLPHQKANQEDLFAYYPPIYPLLYGVWSSVFGVSLTASQAFDALIRCLRTLFLFLLLLPYLWRDTSARRIGLIVFILCLWSLITTESDRPDDLAVCFGLLSWLCIGKLSGWKKILFAGLFVGLTAGTSPAAGVFFSITALFWIRRKEESWPFTKGILLLAISIFIYFVINLPIYLSDPQAYIRFQKQVPMSTFPYLASLNHGSYRLAYQSLFKNLTFYTAVGWRLSCFLVGLIPMALFIALRLDRRDFRRAIIEASLILAPCFFLIWSLQPFYMWFCITGLLFGTLGGLNLLNSSFFQRALIAIIMLAFLPLIFHGVKAVYVASKVPKEDSVSSIQAMVLPLIPPYASLAVTPDQYFTFKGQREIANVAYVCDRLNDFDFVYITRYTTSSVNVSSPAPVPCIGADACFKVLKDFSSYKAYRAFGIASPRYVAGNGGVLYQNVCKPN